MKKALVLVCVACLLTLCCSPAALASPPAGDSALMSLTHNLTNTGVMLPEVFNPMVTSYILTTASWVSRVNFIPVSVNPMATILINGVYVLSGQKTADFEMTDKPQAVTIAVTAPSMQQTVYTVFLQRRPSEARTYSSVGYLKDMYVKNGGYYMDFDLVTPTWAEGSNKCTAFINDSTHIYKYPVRANAILYRGDYNNPVRSRTAENFRSHVTLSGAEMFRVVYIDDEIIAVSPFAVE